jgi:two-component system, chemotaxis family, chemotaxis protein CheY
MAKSVLVVDDSKSIRQLLRVTLEQAGYEVADAADGLAATELLDGRALNAILCDISMPRMDGIAFLRHVRQHPRYRSTPFILLTTETRIDVKEAGRKSGAQAFLNKPCTPSQVLDALQRVSAAGVCA